MKVIDGNQSKAQAPKAKKRAPIFKQLKSAGYEVARIIVAADGSQIIEIAGSDHAHDEENPWLK